MSKLLEYMSHFNNISRKMALLAADPFTGAVAEGLLCGIAEPGWKSAAFPVNAELFAQNCSRVGILTTSSRPPAQRGFRGPVRGGGATSRPPRLVLALVPLSSSSWTDGSKGAFVFAKNPFVRQESSRTRWTGGSCDGSPGTDP